jgi:hypothetical protein
MKRKYLSLLICTIILIGSVGFNYAPSAAGNPMIGIWDLKDTTKIVATTKVDRMLVFYPNMSFSLTTELSKKRTSYRGTYTFTGDKLNLNYKDGSNEVKRTLNYAFADTKTLNLVNENDAKKISVTFSKFVK